jgi:hypothetical protein
MAAVTGQYQHLGAGCTDLRHFAAAVEDPFVVVSRGQRAAAAAAADLVQPVGMQVNPILKTLVHDPSGLFEIAVAESFFGPSPIITGVVVGGPHLKPTSVQANASALDILDEQVKHGNRFKFF